jgi:hypothetical protein
MASIKTISITHDGCINVKVEQPGSELNLEYTFDWLMKVPYTTFESIFKNTTYGLELVQHLKRAYNANAVRNGNNNPFAKGPKITKPASWKFKSVVTDSTEDSISEKIMDVVEGTAGIGGLEPSPVDFKRNIDME